MTAVEAPARKLAAVLLAGLVLLVGPLAAQSEDPLQGAFEAAQQVHQSADQYDSIALLTDVISRLERRAELTAEGRDLLARAYFLRAEAHYNFGETQQGSESLVSAVRTDPNFEIDLTLISPKLAEQLGATRRQIAGMLVSAVEPADAVARVEGAPPLVAGDSISLLAGQHEVRIERPGYESSEQTIDLVAGQETRLETELRRTSAVLHVLTQAPGVTVLVDGREAGTTGQQDDGMGVLVVDGLQPGSHTVELQGRGYRNRRVELDLAALDDYATDVLALDSTRGNVRLAGLLPGSTVRINGTEQRFSGGDNAAFDVPAGANHVEVDYRGIGRFARHFEVADGQTIGFEVELRPVIALLGVLGGDQRSATELQGGVESFFEQSEGWTVADHSAEGAAVLAAGNLNIDKFRELAMTSPSMIARYDWSAFQKACDDRLGAAAYLVAVLSDDLIASSADLWILPSAPHPPLPQRIRTEVGGADVVAKTLGPISRRPSFARPWLGVRLIETNATPGLVVLNVTTGSPAEAAGLKPGDVVTTAAGATIDRLADLERLLDSTDPHSGLQLTLSRPSGPATVDIVLGTSPMVLSWTDPSTFYPLYLGWLEIEKATGQSELEPWLIELNQASALMGLGSWTDAIRLLRTIQAPSGGGVGQAMVDYWLGMALIRTDPNQYRDIALDRLTQAEADSTARLYHNDGPLIAPLAAASKKMLSGGGS